MLKNGSSGIGKLVKNQQHSFGQYVISQIKTVLVILANIARH